MRASGLARADAALVERCEAHAEGDRDALARDYLNSKWPRGVAVTSPLVLKS